MSARLWDLTFGKITPSIRNKFQDIIN
jgi:hypothetical protein